MSSSDCVHNILNCPCSKMAISIKDHGLDETVWTALLAGCVAYDLEHGEGSLFHGLTGHHHQSGYDLGVELLPLTPRKSEGNTHLDMALGAIATRDGTQAGIQYKRSESSMVCFVEAKMLSDISTRVEHSPIRDQMTRVMENLLCFQTHDGGQSHYPEHLVFTLLTPRLFLENPHTRFYGFLFEEYVDDLAGHQQKLRTAIEKYALETASRRDWNYPTIAERLPKLSMRWVCYEDLLKEFVEEYASTLWSETYTNLVVCSKTDRHKILTGLSSLLDMSRKTG